MAYEKNLKLRTGGISVELPFLVRGQGGLIENVNNNTWAL